MSFPMPFPHQQYPHGPSEPSLPDSPATPRMGNVVYPGVDTPDPGIAPPAFAGAAADMAGTSPEQTTAPQEQPQELGSLALEATVDLSTNTTPIESELASPPQSPYEIRRTKGHTILVNTAHTNPDHAEQVAADLSNGIPDSWPAYDDGTGSVRYRVDNAENPTVFVKIRGDSAALQEKMAQLPDHEDPNYLQASARQIRRVMSVSHEMRLAPDISTALQHETAQEIVKGEGFTSVNFVAPLTSVIDAETGQKATAYPWQPGRSIAVSQEEMWDMDDVPEARSQEIDKLMDVCDRLQEYMESRGIKATDMRPGNFIVSEDDQGAHLHVINSESYTRINPSTPASTSEPPEASALWLPPEADMQGGAPPAKILAMRTIRQQEHARSATTITTFKQMEEAVGMRAWGPANAGLRTGRNSFESWFANTLPAGTENLQEYIEETLRAIPPDERRAMEIGGPGSGLFRPFGNYFAGTLSINLTDTRDPQTAITDATFGHRLIIGNMMDHTTKYQVETWLGEQKAALIIQRMFYGIRSLPNDALENAREAAYWYSKLATGGLMLAQMSPALAYHVKPWYEFVKANYPAMDIQLGNATNDVVNIRIHKQPGSPERLPLLPAKYVLWREAQRRGQYSTI